MSLERLRSICADHQVILCGVLKPTRDPNYEAFQRWIKAKKHGQMKYLENYPHLRQYPAQLESTMPSVIVCAYPYGEKSSITKTSSSLSSSLPTVAQYARFKDYHRSLKKTGQHIISSYFKSQSKPFSQSDYRVVVDSAPILEKSLAEQTGSGFIGKNTLFILKNRGSLLFLFEIYTTATFETQPLSSSPLQAASTSPSNGCGRCRRCQVHCPTGALDEDYVLDATKCLAYYTIEHRGTIPVGYWPYLAVHFFGCDICQLVCPHNRYARAARDLKPVIPTDLCLAKIACMDEKTYIAMFAGTPMTRAKRAGIRRNALIAMTVTSHPHLEDVVRFVIRENHPLLIATLNQRDEYKKMTQSSSFHLKQKQLMSHK